MAVSYIFANPFAERNTLMYASTIGGRCATVAKLLDMLEPLVLILLFFLKWTFVLLDVSSSFCDKEQGKIFTLSPV